jgi:hypothetical protein
MSRSRDRVKRLAPGLSQAATHRPVVAPANWGQPALQTPVMESPDVVCNVHRNREPAGALMPALPARPKPQLVNASVHAYLATDLILAGAEDRRRRKVGGGKSEHPRARRRVTSFARAGIHAGGNAARRSDGQCHRNSNRRRPLIGPTARVKRWGKSPPPQEQSRGHGKPRRVQGQIGNRGVAHAVPRVKPGQVSGTAAQRNGPLRSARNADRIRLTARPGSNPRRGQSSLFSLLRVNRRRRASVPAESDVSIVRTDPRAKEMALAVRDGSIIIVW